MGPTMNALNVTKKGIERKHQRIKAQILVDKIVAQDCKTRCNNLCTACIENNERCNCITHMWILKNLKLYKLNRKLCALTMNSTGMPKTDQTNYAGQHQEQHLSRKCFVPTAVQQRPEPPESDHLQE